LETRKKKGENHIIEDAFDESWRRGGRTAIKKREIRGRGRGKDNLRHEREKKKNIKKKLNRLVRERIASDQEGSTHRHREKEGWLGHVRKKRKVAAMGTWGKKLGTKDFR